MLSKNLIKANQFVLKEKDPIIVDTNGLVAQKIESHAIVFEEFKPEGFQFGLNAPEVDPLFVDMDYVPEEGEFPMELVAQEPVYTGPSPEELIAEAQAEIEEMRIEAEKNISFEEFKDGLVFTPEDCGYKKNILVYLDGNNPEVVLKRGAPDEWTATDKYAISMYPAGYDMSLTKEYKNLIDLYNNRKGNMII